MTGLEQRISGIRSDRSANWATTTTPTFLNGPSPASFSFIFGLFQTNINTILQQINVKNVHPVYSTGIRTHDLQNLSLLP